MAALRGEAAGLPRPRRVLPAGLTEREVEVLCLAARGLSNRQIGEELSISSRTVGHHLAHIYDKTSRRSRAGMAVLAMDHRLAAPTSSHSRRSVTGRCRDARIESPFSARRSIARCRRGEPRCSLVPQLLRPYTVPEVARRTRGVGTDPRLHRGLPPLNSSAADRAREQEWEYR
ncbi:MAG TPA: LuxR C-terminal-related transcriptional regulator [Streptomyces sp.]|nr:LuxR C-terminal-related transcriptional regulator [Streptomyces sp.]